MQLKTNKAVNLKPTSIILVCIILLPFIVFLFTRDKNEREVNTSETAQVNPFIFDKYSLCNCLQFENQSILDTDILGTWYLEGYNNVQISFKPKYTLSSTKLLYTLSSVNIDLSTLDAFIGDTYHNGLIGWDAQMITNFYSPKLINGRLGTLLLTRDSKTMTLKRGILPNAITGYSNSGCNGSINRN